MPIPQFNEYGILPPGIHDCTFEEIRECFGGLFSSPVRRRLCDSLEQFLDEVRSTGMAAAMIVNGSFVTDKDDPGDIDMILVLRADHDIPAELRPFEYNIMSKKRVRRAYGLDLLVARENSDEMARYIGLFRQVRGRRELQKGLLRVRA